MSRAEERAEERSDDGETTPSEARIPLSSSEARILAPQARIPRAKREYLSRRAKREYLSRRAKREYLRRRQGYLERSETPSSEARIPLSSSEARIPAPQARISEAVVGRPRSAVVERSEDTSAAGKDISSAARIPAPQARIPRGHPRSSRLEATRKHSSPLSDANTNIPFLFFPQALILQHRRRRITHTRTRRLGPGKGRDGADGD